MSSRPLRCIAIVLALGTALFASVPAHADHNRRGGFGYGFSPFGARWVGIDGIALSVGDDFGSFNDDAVARPRGLRLRSGFNVNRFFGVEAHGAFGTDRSVESFDRVDTWIFAGFFRGSLPIGRAVRLNGLAGLATVGLRQTIDNSDFSDRAGSFAFGASMDVQLGRRTSLTGGWTRYSNGFGAVDTVSGFTLGIQVGFY